MTLCYFFYRRPPSDSRAGLQLFTTLRWLRWQSKPELNKNKTDNSSSCFNYYLQHCNNYLTRYSDVDIVCGQPVRHYAAPLLGGITKTNAA